MTTPSPSSPMEVRLRVFRFLLERLSVPDVAARLAISRQAVLSHAKALIRGGVLVQESKPRAPLVVAPGPRADAFVRAVETPTTSPGGAVAAWKAHAWSWGIYFTSGPRREPVGARRVVSSKVLSLIWSLDVAGEAWTLRAYMGASRRTLAAYPPPVWVDGLGAAGAHAERGRVAESVLRSVGREWGFALVGAVRQLGPAEFALPVPGLPKEGVAGSSRVWVDETPPPSSLETRDLSVVEAVSRLPRILGDVDARLDAIELRVARLVGVAEATVSFMEKKV